MSRGITDRSWLLRPQGALLVFAVVTGAAAWWLVALPVLTLSNVERHSSHFQHVLFHTIGGTVMLVAGAANLYLGATQKYFRLHRPLGYAYLVGGGVGAVLAIMLALGNGHKKPTIPFMIDPAQASDTGWALATLGFAWLLAAAMAYHAARNRNFSSHQEWMVRSYVLAWSFVLCRLIGKIPNLPGVGSGAAIVWLSWIIPLLLCEVVLQWPDSRRS